MALLPGFTQAVVAIVLSAVALPALAADAWTTFVVVRHAEKVDDSLDPSLNDAGRRRAELLASMLADSGIDAIHTSQFKRTRETAAPVARRLGLQVVVDPIQGEDHAGEQRALAEQLIAKHAGERVLIVGHSDTVPLLIDALGVPGLLKIPESDYHNLFVVERPATGPARLLHLHYGP
jgi:broad specificity phosphatase PhoE